MIKGRGLHILEIMSVHCVRFIVRNVWRTGAMRVEENCNFQVTTRALKYCMSLLYLAWNIAGRGADRTIRTTVKVS